MKNSSFKVMAFFFRLRDIFRSPLRKLEEAEIKQGWIILDFGCGPGSYSIAAGDLVGETGRVYAVDIHPLAIKMVQERVSKKKLNNIETILTDCETNLENNSIDLVLMFDVFHGLQNPDRILAELYRILKDNAFLCFDDHHMKEAEILSRITSRGLFKFSERKKLTYLFQKSSN